ncbi:Qat anti-phage system TatD family nuclease QatD [Acidovorax sp.]|uniref:Qat anti-phage system TatD family nuclease QatD n=1 Tax=Acidovorax sp. TaxID=1872122 RepID=UPI002ACEE4BC|nr:Qat anti-phage system TatD family nuclease QatD [Acidovorax sp.]MDZ7866000.1 Qat anti-phage system TatD family nuclease QatD [Acidovorax sp.]
MDFHCHLDLYPGAKAVSEEAALRNEFTWLVTTSPRAYDATSRVLGHVPRVLITPGLHPELVETRAGELPQLLQQMEHAVAVGEVGLDGSYRFKSSLAIQRQVFDAVVSRSRELGGRTLSIHSRGAAKEVLSILLKNPGFGTAVLHWFTGTVGEMETAYKLGCWFSIGPAAFNSAAGRTLVAKIPRDRVVPESDGPFAEDNGVPVQPWSMERTAQLFAPQWECAEPEAFEILRTNGRRLLRTMGRLL